MTTLSRPLPLELHAEIHKCLPLPNAIHILVNISSRTFVDINSARMHRNIQRIKTSLNEYIGTLVGEERKNDREKLIIYKEIEWKPELDALFRGSCLLVDINTRIQYDLGLQNCWNSRKFRRKINSTFAEFMKNSSSTQMTLRYMGINFERELHPIPTCLEQLLNKKEQYQLIGDRILFESIQLEMDNGHILQIFDGELKQCQFSGNYTLRLLMKKMDGMNWFQIVIDMDSSQKFIERFEFSKWNMQSFDDIANFIKAEYWLSNDNPIKENDNKLEAKDDINWNGNLDVFLRRGTAFSQFRHFSMKKYGLWLHPKYYLDFLISYISNAKNPQDLLESIDINLKDHCSFTSLLIDRISAEVGKEGGISINLDNTKLHILSAKIVESKKKFEFTLVNIPTNGTYLFDVVVQFGYQGLYKIVGIKIQKRKNDGNIAQLKCEDQIEKGKKRKATNDDDGEVDQHVLQN